MADAGSGGARREPGLSASGLVTPEAVAIDLPVATVGSRGLALLIDVTIMGVVVLALSLGAGLTEAVTGGLPGWVGVVLVTLLIFGIQFGYPVGFETLWHGRTPGKAAMGLRVVTVEGGPIRFRHAAVRAALGLVDFLASGGGIAVVSSLVSRRGQRLGDLVAGTLVLRERSGQGAAVAMGFRVSAGLEGFARQLDVSGLTVAQYATIRTFLQRAPQLTHEVRTRLAGQVADGIEAAVRPARPAGVDDLAYLHTIAAAYQRRHSRWGAAAQGVGTSPAPRSATPPPPRPASIGPPPPPVPARPATGSGATSGAGGFQPPA